MKIPAMSLWQNIINYCVIFSVVVLITQAVFSIPVASQTLAAPRLQLKLSDEVVAAVENGIKLTFASSLAYPQKWFFITWNRVSTTHEFELTHHALSDRYLVRTPQRSSPVLFRTLRAALDFVASESIALMDNKSQKQQAPLLRINLVKYKLPGPMRLNAFLSNAWKSDTGWIAWTLEQQ